MEKAILVLDKMPKSCIECPLMFRDGYDDCCCPFLSGTLFDYALAKVFYYDKERHPNNCPLRPLPQEKEELYYPCNEYEQAFNEGYNRSIDDILGE